MRLHERLRAHAMTAAVVDQPPDPSDVGALLRWALTRLREPDREILRLVAWEGCTTGELATVLGCSSNAAAVRLHRARRRLRKVLAEVPPDTAANATPTVTTARGSRRRP